MSTEILLPLVIVTSHLACVHVCTYTQIDLENGFALALCFTTSHYLVDQFMPLKCVYIC